MYVLMIAAFVCGGTALAWAAVSRPAIAAQLEYAGGALLIVGLALLGYALRNI